MRSTTVRSTRPLVQPSKVPTSQGSLRNQRWRCTMTARLSFSSTGKVEAEPDETIWQLAQRHGTKIPHLCWHPAPGYRADGNCRACMVEVEGERVLAASCQRKAAAGMKVKTASRAGQEIARDGVRAADGRPARARGEPRSGVQVLELGRRHGRHAHPALSGGDRPTADVRIPPSRSTSTPASTAACACAPAARCR